MSTLSSQVSGASTANPIQRLLLLKVFSQSDQDTIISLFASIRDKATRDGQPYILSLKGGSTSSTAFTSEARSQGYTVVVHTEFAGEADVRYWDDECAAHKELKRVVMPLTEGAMVLHFRNGMPL